LQNLTKLLLNNDVYEFLIMNLPIINLLDKNNSKLQNHDLPSKQFMAMFLGFIDGDGYITIIEQKQYNKKTKDLVRSTIQMKLGTNLKY
jgi:hypothetical protein